jgi:transcriptional regulator with XRE-family HTH domain
MRTLGERLRHLVATYHPRDRGPYSYREIAQAINRHHGDHAISHVYVAQLCKGERANPTVRHLEMLANFFNVPMAYFFDDVVAEKINAEIDMIAAFRDAGVRDVALRVAGLSPLGRDVIRDMVENVSRLEDQRTNGPKHE